MNSRIGKVLGGAAIGAMLLVGSTMAFAQTTYTPSDSSMTSGTGTAVTTGAAADTSVTPGIPNTGTGGDAAGNYATLGIAALIVIAGAAYLVRRRFSTDAQ